MQFSAVEELEKKVQRLIEERLPQGGWHRAYGRVESPESGGFRGYWYETKNPAGVESLSDWLPVQEALDELLRRVNAVGCDYSFEPGGVISFQYIRADF